MMKRKASAILILFLIGLITSAFYYYEAYRNKVLDLPIEQARIQEKYLLEYEAEKERVLSFNREIYSEVLKEFERLGGDVESLSRFDNVRFMNGSGDTSNELLNSIPHEPLEVIKMAPPATEKEIIATVAKDKLKLDEDFRHSLFLHGYIFIVGMLAYIFTLLVFSKKSRSTESSN